MASTLLLQFPFLVFSSVAVAAAAFHTTGRYHCAAIPPHRNINCYTNIPPATVTRFAATGSDDGDDLDCIDPTLARSQSIDNGPSAIEETVMESRIVATADEKIPSTTAMFPSSPFHVMLQDNIDSIYNAINNQNLKKLSRLEEEEEEESQAGEGQQQQASNGNSKIVNSNTIQILKESLESSGFELLSQRDLDLCEALNEGYLLRLSIAPDVEDLDFLYSEFYDGDYNEFSNDDETLPFDGKVLVFRRGYSQEITTGKLLLPKLDYLQSSLVQRSASELTRRLSRLERAFTSRVTNAYQKQFQPLFETKLDSLKEQILDEVSLEDDMNARRVEETLEKGVNKLKNALIATGESLNKTKINIKLGRYKSFGDDADPLNSFLVYNMEPQNDDTIDGNELSDRSSVEQELMEGIVSGSLSCKYDAQQASFQAANICTDITSTNGVPTNQLLNRVSIANLVDFFSKGGRRRLIKSLFTVSELQEPTYEQVVLVWRPSSKKPPPPKVWVPPKFVYTFFKIFDLDHKLPQPPEPYLEPLLPLEIRTFDRVPMANLLAVLPKTKLVFRPADALIFDLINSFSFLAVLASSRFDSAKLDLLAFGAVALWIIRTFFRYSNKIARYDLVVNKFLTSRLSYRNKGALKYLTSEAAVQRARRASLVHEWLMDDGFSSGPNDRRTRDEIERVGLSQLNSRLDRYHCPLYLDVSAAVDDLIELGLLHFDDMGQLEEVKSGEEAVETLANLWNGILQMK